MFETLVPSKTRRTLLEHILLHPNDRFYLRGLARDLGLAVSPVRRELKRLEHLGVLKAYQEANIRFYVVDQTSTLFTQLKQATLTSPSPRSQEPVPATDLPASLHSLPTGSAGGQAVAQATLTKPNDILVASTVLSHPQIERIRRMLRPRLTVPTILAALSVCLVVALVLGGGLYLAVTNQRLMALTKQAVSAPKAQVAVVETSPAASGEMRSSRWRLLPGAMGGFSAGPSEESY